MKKWCLFFGMFLLFIGKQAGAAWYSYFEQHGLPADKITCLSNEVNGEIWVGTVGGLARFHNGQFTVLTMADGLLSDTINSIHVQASGDVWVGYGPFGSDVVSLISGNTITHFPVAGSGFNKKIIAIAAGNGTIYAVSREAVFVKNNNQFDRISSPADSLDVIGCGPFTGNSVVVGFSKGVYRYTGNTWVPLKQTSGLMRKIKSLPSGEIFVSAIPSNFLYTDNQWAVLDSADPVRNLFTSSFAKGTDGTLFFSCRDQNGWKILSRKNGKTLLRSRVVNGYYNAVINSLSSLNDKIMLATDSGLVVMDETSTDKTQDYLNVNHLMLPLTSNGQIGALMNDSIGYHRDENGVLRSVLYQANLWLYAEHSGTEYISAQIYSSESGTGEVVGASFFAGPVASDYDKPYDNRVWRVTSGDVAAHLAGYFNPAYVMPDAIANWPAHGNVQYGEASCLAPFEDNTSDWNYHPETGDVPAVLEDEIIYAIFNDENGKRNHLSTTGPLGVEMHLMLFGKSSTTADLSNTVFAQYVIINRTAKDFVNMYVGLWNDMDIGNPMDDYIGCDTNLQLFYTYNGSTYDPDKGDLPGFADRPPAMGVVFLNSKLSSFSYVEPSNLAMQDVKYILTRNRLTEGDSAFMFWGDPVSGNGWIETQMPFDRRSVGVTGPYELMSGETLTLDMAFVFARDTALPNPASVGLLKQRVSAVKDYYENTSDWDLPFGICAPLSVRKSYGTEAELLLFPNPAGDRITLTTGQDIDRVQLYDVQGRLISVANPNGSSVVDMDVSALSTGVYIVRIWSGNKVFRSRLVKE